MTCPYYDCSITGPHSHGIGTALSGYGNPSSLPDAIDAIREEWDQLRRELAEREAVCQAHMELRYNAERDLAQATEELGTATDELAEIKRILIAFHRQEGDGIVSVKRLAKRLHEGSASPADLTPGVPFSAPGVPFSFGGTE